MYHLQTGSYVQYNGTWFIALGVTSKNHVKLTNPTQAQIITVPRSDLCVSKYEAELVINQDRKPYLRTLKSGAIFSLYSYRWVSTAWFNKNLAVTSKPKQLQLAL
jgi:uncharacterized membrane protein YcfT